VKKVILSFLVMGLLIGGAFARVQAQEKKAAFSLNLGVQTNLYQESSFDNAWFTLDARAGIALGKSFEISPEVMAMVDDSLNFDAVWLYPGLMLNFKLGNLFVGAGAVLPIVIWERESDSGNPAPKVNIGYSAGHLTLTAYILTRTEKYMDFLEVNFIGATLGYKF
jgi:hypothetical protein